MQDDLIRVSLGKGCYIVITRDEFIRGIKRGKQLRRIEDVKRREETSATPYPVAIAVGDDSGTGSEVRSHESVPRSNKILEPK